MKRITTTDNLTEIDEMVAQYQGHAEGGDPEAQLFLGSCYRQGKGVEQNDVQAFYWTQCAAEQGYTPAQLYLADCYLDGCGTAPDSKQAVAWIKKAAEQGDAEGQSCLGHCYLEGFGVEKDAEQAVVWFQKAAEQGSGSAQFGLAACFFHGWGVSRNDVNAVSYCKLAAEQNNVKALLQLGACYMYGKGVVKNLRTAEEYLCRAIACGDEFGWDEEDEQSENEAKAHRLLAESCYAHYIRDDLSLNALDIANCIPFLNLASWSATFVIRTGEKAKLKKFLKTEEGQFMLEHFQIAADLGDKEAISMLRKCS